MDKDNEQVEILTDDEIDEINVVVEANRLHMIASPCDDDGAWHAGPFVRGTLSLGDDVDELRLLNCEGCEMALLLEDGEPWPKSFGGERPE